jgi:hypothetical protein
VSQTFCLITAALLAGQAPEMRVAPVPADGIITSNPGCNCNRGMSEGTWQQGRIYQEPSERGGLFSRLGRRLRSLFGDDEQSEPMPNGPQRQVIETPPTPAPVINSEPPLAGQSQGQPVKVTVRSSPAPQAQITSVQPQAGVQIIEEKQGTTLTGRLAFLPANGGTWMVRHGDGQGGLAVLSTSANMDGFRNGDLVTVEGDFQNGQAPSGLGAPIFRAHTVRVLEHAQ